MSQAPKQNDTSLIENMIEELLFEYRREPVDFLNIGDIEGGNRRLAARRYEYARTVTDIISHFKKSDINSIRALEIGCFRGLVSVVLSKLGFRVTATDLKEYIACENLQKKFNRYGVDYVGCNLRDYKLPFNDEAFDVVIMCEVLEHLNFNPLPVIKEINRILKQDGLFYLALPNIASLGNRLKLLQGESIHNPIKDFFAQLNPNDNMIVGLHWREYTTAEIREMLEQMDFEVIKQELESKPGPATPRAGFKEIIKKPIRYILSLKPVRNVIYSCLFDSECDPSLEITQVNFALKRKMCLKKFHFTDATLINILE